MPLNLTGTSDAHRALPFANNASPVTRRFFESKIMEAEKHYQRQRPRAICAECGDELVLSRSGHRFCANHLCKEGFDIKPDWRAMPLPAFVAEEKKPR
jgi:hypothetical protein